MMRHPARIVALLGLFCLLLVPVQGTAGTAAAFKSAWHGFYSLTKDAKRSKYRAYWQELEREFLSIYKENPDGPFAPKALYYAGRVCDELGHRSYLKTDFIRAVDYYNRVLTRFPKHSWSDDCLYRIAVIRFNKLNDPEQAKRDCQRLLKKYPKGDMWPKAQELLREIDDSDASGAPVVAAKPHPQPAGSKQVVQDALAAQIKELENRKAAAQKQAAQKAVEQAVAQEKEQGVPMHAAVETPPQRPDGKRVLNSVRYQSSDVYTRVVINLDYETPFRYQLLGPNDAYNRPHRLYIDLDNTILAHKIDRNMDIADGILRRVRIAQNKPTVSRVVLDFQDLQNYQIFALHNPYRLIVDVSAPSKKIPPQIAAAAAQEQEVLKITRPSKKTPAESAEPKKQQLPILVPASPENTRHPVSKPKKRLGQRPLDTDGKQNNGTTSQAAASAEKSPWKNAWKDETAAKQPAAQQAKKEKPADARPVNKNYKLPPGSKKQMGSLVEQLGLTINTIMIDAGHGGKDPGASGARGIKEKDINLRFAKILGKKLEQKGFKVRYTRTSDTFIALEDRTAMANLAKVDLFISIHCNAFMSSKMTGLETYYLDLATSKDAVRVAARENAGSAKSVSDLQVILTDLMLHSKIDESKDLAVNVQKRIVRNVKKKYKIRDHGVRSAPFYVLVGATMPAILVEMGYITNPAEAKRLTQKRYLERLADGLVDGISAYKRQIERFASASAN